MNNILSLLLTIIGGCLAVGAASLVIYGAINPTLGISIFAGVLLAFIGALLVEL